MRLFISLPIPDDLRTRIVYVQKQFSGFRELKLVEPENLHFTLFFIGESDYDTYQKIKHELHSVAQSGFSVAVNGIGAFPDLKSPRIVWVGAQSEGLMELQGRISNVLSKLGFKEDRPYASHLTLARVRPAKIYEKLNNILESIKNTNLGSFRAKEFHLMESFLGPKGPTYEVKQIYRLSEPQE